MSGVRLMLGLAAMLALAGCGEQAAAPAAVVVRPVLSVVAHPVASRTLGPYVGSIEPRDQAPLSFQSSGRMIARPVGVGDSVSKGELLASLDAATQQFQLTSAQADVASAQSQLNNLAAAEERAKSLVSTGAAPQAQLDSATSARQTAEAQLAQAKASLARAQDELGYASISAPYAGVVVSTGAEIGQVVGAGQMVVTVARPEVREAVFELPETESAGPLKNAKWTVTLVGAPDEIVAGTVREIAPLINGSTRSQTVRLTLADPPEAFRLGATVNVSTALPIAPRFELPPSALLEQGGKTLVWIVDPKAGTVSARPVTVGDKTAAAIDVTGGLGDGDRVVVAGVHSLTEGQQVKLDGSAP